MSLVHWWPFTAGLKDQITNISLDSYWGESMIRDGKLGSAQPFTGRSHSRLETPYKKTLSNQEFSIALWLRLKDETQNDTTNTNGHQIFTIGKWGTTWTAQRATIFIKNDNENNNKLYFTISDGTNSIEENGPHSEALTPHRWYHVVAIIKNNTAYLYIDGELASSCPLSYLPNFDSTGDDVDIYIGGNSTAVGKYDIGDVRVYNHALSLLEIKTLNQALMFHCSFNVSSTQLIANETGLLAPGTISSIKLVNQQNLPTGNYCGQFDGSYSRILFPIGKNGFFTNDYTISFWVYPLNTKQAVYLRVGNKFIFERCVGDEGGFKIIYNGNEGWSGVENIEELGTTINTWTMISITYTNSTLTFYKNGKEKKSIEEFSPKVNINYTDNMEIGRGGSIDTTFDGYMSDFRLYASALSDQEIEELYSCGGRISNLGDVLTGSFIEGAAAIKINKNHTIDINEIIEQDEAKASFKKDGTIIARQLIEI